MTSKQKQIKNNERIKSFILGRKAPKVGVTPSIALINPKFPHNVGAAIRIASCYGASQVWYTGDRIDIALGAKKRLPREERMKGYADVDLIQNDYFLDQFPKDVVPVAIEVRENAEPLHTFIHPEKALYIFGPEDGSTPKVYRRHCHRFVVIPTRHCLNLAMAVGTVLYDRTAKELAADESGKFITPGEYEERGNRRVAGSEIPDEFQL